MAGLSTRLDHLVIVAASLEQGAAYCEEMLGLHPQRGGEHLKMGTHNLLLRLGDKAYLEIIAVNPQAARMSRPRWFGMDRPETKRRAEQKPFLATFVAATNDIDACSKAMPALGEILDMQRGTLAWRIAVPDDGALIDGGTVPPVIQWPEGVHPATGLAPLGCSLLRLEVRHPDPVSLAEKWRCIGLHAGDLLEVRQAQECSLAAHIATPSGMRLLS